MHQEGDMSMYEQEGIVDVRMNKKSAQPMPIANNNNNSSNESQASSPSSIFGVFGRSPGSAFNDCTNRQPKSIFRTHVKLR